MSRILWLAPADWRRRYGTEVLDLLAGSERPVADRLDLLWMCLRLRAAAIRERSIMRRFVLVASIGTLALGAVWVMGARQRLQDGLVELPSHWWSAPGLGLLVAGAAGVIWLAWPRHRVA
ncbi:MAG: hypothetical protein H0V23_09715 [Nocardioidaceae bacterium]|nr:hypothetical protein [Nocardioidaceae bacterium]